MKTFAVHEALKWATSALQISQSAMAGVPPLQRLVLAVKRPAGAVLASQQVVRLRAVGNAVGGPIVADLFSDAISRQAQKHHFDHFAAIIEIAGGFPAALAGVNPLPL